MIDKGDRLFIPSNCHRLAFRLVKINVVVATPGLHIR